jgi:tetratricopeptide (TPR) repeat protein
VIAIAPDDPAVHDAAAWQYNEIGYYPEAISHFERVLELDPEAMWPLIGQSQAYQAMGDFESAGSLLDAAMARPRVDDPDLYENVGWGYSAIEAWPQAQAAFRLVLEINPANTSAWGGLADATYHAEGVDAALAVTHEALAQNPSDPSLHEKAGWYAWELGDTQSAEDSFLQALELDSTYSSSYTSLASIYHDLERLEDAIAILERGTEAIPSDPWLKEALGNSYLERGEAQLAFEQFAAALEIEPNAGWLAFEAATAYYRHSGDPAGTLSYLERAAEIGSGDQYLLEAIGLLYEELGYCQQAEQLFRRALEIDSTLERSQAGLGRCLG